MATGRPVRTRSGHPHGQQLWLRSGHGAGPGLEGGRGPPHRFGVAEQHAVTAAAPADPGNQASTMAAAQHAVSPPRAWDRPASRTTTVGARPRPRRRATAWTRQLEVDDVAPPPTVPKVEVTGPVADDEDRRSARAAAVAAAAIPRSRRLRPAPARGPPVGRSGPPARRGGSAPPRRRAGRRSRVETMWRPKL